ncbi:Taxadiene 5-alpha hydroxylase [Morella rubra]|uniref:Taxadiene 5-alpha hydroxylase n=1 Tax=Morella rubra TaxID=262757 RepID=A0A6A1V3N7_9ROSI|nr:Taxadiene 5-alpha hydroxylase [Morella rubra]
MLVNAVRQRRKEIEGKSEGGNEDGTLMSTLVAGMIRGEITEEEAIDNVVLLVFAAHDTTSYAIAMIFKMLAQHPKCYALLLQEHGELLSNEVPGENLSFVDVKKMKYTWKVARETMRLFPPIFGSFRKAIAALNARDSQFLEDGSILKVADMKTTLCLYIRPFRAVLSNQRRCWGYVQVLWTAYGTHYNTEYFKNPLSFDPRRFDEPIPPNAFVPFGGGPRM